MAITELTTIQEQAYSVHTKPQTYGVERGIDGYSAYLPLLGGEPIKRVIQHAVEEKVPARILDIGMGSGKFLSDCIDVWGGSVLATGITAHDYRSSSQATSSKIEAKIGDANELEAAFPGRKFDIVVSVQAMDYLADPWKCLMEGYNKSNVFPRA